MHSDYQSYAKQVVQTINKLGLRMEIPSAKKRINQHLLLARQYKIPYVIIVGEVEAQQQTIMVRNLATAEQQQMTISAFLAVLKKRQVKKTN